MISLDRQIPLAMLVSWVSYSQAVYNEERIWTKWSVNRKVRGSNPTSLSRLGQPGNIPALVPPSCGMAATHRKSGKVER
ncbi:hypothetical protein T265_09791 [Opisthorchis viverrini]|uniref:Uncharacterized protein n=1 Tax=Opisthorchis viverrini TaxID=6198 RepID=A0A075A3R6_OPIVI|nr:hypothetical protein T265_09791 [Opisthorchis viverrini]KER22039.1 hypothetical protein T265_09791 [Opisthorchis viverrini]